MSEGFKDTLKEVAGPLPLVHPMEEVRKDPVARAVDNFVLASILAGGAFAGGMMFAGNPREEKALGQEAVLAVQGQKGASLEGKNFKEIKDQYLGIAEGLQAKYDITLEGAIRLMDYDAKKDWADWALDRKFSSDPRVLAEAKGAVQALYDGNRGWVLETFKVDKANKK